MLCAVASCPLLTVPKMQSIFNKPVTEYTHTVWTHEVGLPSAFIYSITQTRDGYALLGNADGLVRFDGVASSMGVPNWATRRFWAPSILCARRRMEVCASVLAQECFTAVGAMT